MQQPELQQASECFLPRTVLRKMETYNGYTIESLLYVSENSHTYLVQDKHGVRSVAKVVRLVRKKESCQLSQDDVRHARILHPKREYLLLQRLRHPNVVKPLDYFELDFSIEQLGVLVLEYISGGDLEEFTLNTLDQDDGQQVTALAVLTILRRIAEAIDFIHSKGFLHRDIKPGNILLTSSLVPYLADLGTATGTRISHRLQTKNFSDLVLPDETPFGYRASRHTDISAFARTIEWVILPDLVKVASGSAKETDALSKLDRRDSIFNFNAASILCLYKVLFAGVYAPYYQYKRVQQRLLEFEHLPFARTQYQTANELMDEVVYALLAKFVVEGQEENNWRNLPDL